MTKEEAEQAFEQAYNHLKLSVRAGSMGIFTPDSLKALLRAGETMLHGMEDPDFKPNFVKFVLERPEPPHASVIDLFGRKPGGAA